VERHRGTLINYNHTMPSQMITGLRSRLGRPRPPPLPRADGTVLFNDSGGTALWLLVVVEIAFQSVQVS